MKKEISMRKRIIALLMSATLALTLVASAVPVAAQSGPVEPMSEQADISRTVSVSGSGQVNATPDVAVVTLGVKTNAPTAAEAFSQNNEQSLSLADALKAANIPAEDIQTQQIQLQPQYQQPQPSMQAPQESSGSMGSGTRGVNQPPELIGYTAINAVEVRMGQIDQLGALLDSAVQAGGNRIENIRFEFSDTGDLMDQARQAAWDDALHKAEQLATLSDSQLGMVISINDSSRSPQIGRSMQFAASAAAPIEPGTQTVEVNLDVTWQLTAANMSGSGG